MTGACEFCGGKLKGRQEIRCARTKCRRAYQRKYRIEHAPATALRRVVSLRAEGPNATRRTMVLECQHERIAYRSVAQGKLGKRVHCLPCKSS